MRRRLIGPLLAVAVLLAALTGVLGARAAFAAAGLVRQAQAELTATRHADAGAVVPALEAASQWLNDAETLLVAPLPRLVASVPVVGRSLQAEVAVVRAGSSAVETARRAALSAEHLKDPDGSVDLRVLERLSRDLSADTARAERDLHRLRRVRTRWTPPQVGRAVQEAVAGLTPVVGSLRRAASGAELARSLLGGDGTRRVLIALQNNAELRGSGGHVSSYATGTVADGALQLSPFRDVVDVAEPPARARRVPAPAEFVEDYGPFLADTTLWRTWTMSPDMPVTAQVGAAVAGRLLGVQPDLVLLLDVPALAALAELGGGVRLGSETLAGPELTEALLVDAYAQAGERDADQAARRAALQQAAGAAATSVLRASGSALSIVQRLEALAGERHLALWSARAPDRAILRHLQLDGALAAGAGDLLAINVNNLSGNKLDYYIQRTVRADVVVGRESAHVVQQIRLENTAPEGLVPYVAGIQTPGEAVEIVEFSLSRDASISTATVNGRRATGSVRRGAGRTRVALTVRLRPQEPVDVAVAYDVPLTQGRYLVRLVPQPLARDAQLRLTAQPAAGERLQRGPLVHDVVFTEQHELELDLVAPAPRESGLERLRRWWREPVRLSRW